ncbi:NUDIX hydrolase [Senegalia massiliensis]|uniref:NUDIX hydrolase n=1 Tax=Senegalia massiliensis TaxID=1720316 RepID=A0A845R423_9CLOT|nr:NUDIX hydrolase [Senegalia massiliensis]NBI08182.1 NUDIX hydrolase [Senegalia massiliensis]
MKCETSSGGVVIFNNAILLLKKYNGDWVLPKGRVEENENLSQAAIREVYEEGSVHADIVKYIDSISYSFRNNRNSNNELVKKTVHWFLMRTNSMECYPQKREGFIEARFVHIDRVAELAKYDDEQEVIKKAINEINND